MPEKLGQGVKTAESGTEINFVELFDLVLLSSRHLRMSNSSRNIRALNYNETSNSGPKNSYPATGITRSAVNRDNALSVAVMTLSVGDPNYSIIDQVVNDIDNLIGSQFYCRRLYYSSSEHAEDLSRYRQLFNGVVTGFSVGKKGELTLQVSDRWFDWSLSINRRTFNRMCGFIFKGDRCGYHGNANFCDKTRLACESFNNQARFGGFSNIDEVYKSGVPFV